MGRLGTRDLQAVLSFVRDIEGTDEAGAFVRRTLAGFHRLIACDLATYNEMDSANGRAFASADPGDALFPGVDEILARHLDSHPLVQHYARTRDPRALKLSDFLGRRELHRTDLYQELFRPLNGEYLLAANLEATRSVVIGIGLFRSAGDFSERDRDVMDEVRPHLIQAYLNAELRSLLGALEGVLEGDDRAVIVLDRLDRVRHATPGGARLLRELRGAAGAPRDDVGEWVRAERGRLDPIAGDPRPPAPLVVGPPGSRITLRLLAAGDRDPAVVVMERERPQPSAASIATLGLTRRQAEVLACAARGMTNPQIAGDLFLSRRTVQRHLEQVYDRLGVHTRTAAAAMAFRAAQSVPRGQG